MTTLSAPDAVARRTKQAAPLLAGCVLGAAAEYLFDPNNGTRRRHLARDRALATMRHRRREAIRRARYLEGVAEGAAHRATRVAHAAAGHDELPDDVTLSRKVESVAFRAAHTPKGQVSVNAENGVVYLRGRLDTTDQIAALVDAAGAIDGVKEVKSLLHTPPS
jgi:osmotically-inducible protein OsmY